MDKRAPLITVVIPVYNRAGVVGRTLRSLEEQTLQCFDIVLVDNNSTDKTLEVLEAWAKSQRRSKRKVMVCSETVAGAAAARNCGLTYAETPWVLFFDSDDLMLPEHLSRVENIILGHPGADVVGWNVDYETVLGEHVELPFYDSDMQWHNVVHGSFATHRYCARRDIFVRAGGWNPAVRFWDDIELGARILALNPRVVHAGPEITVKIKATVESITGIVYESTLPLMELPLNLIAETLPPDMRWVCDIKRVIEAALATRQGSKSGRLLLRRMLASCDSRIYRLVLRAAYTYTLHEGRGIASLLRPLFKIRNLK